MPYETCLIVVFDRADHDDLLHSYLEVGCSAAPALAYSMRSE
jgi:hypothetical protein